MFNKNTFKIIMALMMCVAIGSSSIGSFTSEVKKRIIGQEIV